MHAILAESIDGGILAFLMVCGGLVAGVLALCALVPAWKGDSKSTYILAGPAFAGGVFMTFYWIHAYYSDAFHEPDPTMRLSVKDAMGAWILMGAPMLVTCLLAVFVLGIRKARAKQD